ncbi:TetR/AcrR family transcriptional regulator [Mycobacterium sp. HM-7]
MPPNRRGEASRAALLEAGRIAFSENRYEEMSIVDLAKSLGVAAGSISYHFGGKRGFYLAVLEQAADEFWSSLVEMRGPAMERLARGVDQFLDLAQAQPRVFEALITDVADAEVRAIHGRHRERIAHALAVEITGTDSTPVLRAAMNGSLSFMEGVVLHWIREEEPKRDQVHGLIVANLISAVLSAARVDPDIDLSQRVTDAAVSDSWLLSLLTAMGISAPATNPVE